MKKFVILVYFILLLLPFYVKASTVNLVRNRFDNMYTYYYDKNYGRTRYLQTDKYSFNGRMAYCLQIGTNITSISYNAFDNFDNIDINDDDLDFIKKVSYYGYDYPGHNTDKYYLATQNMIWTRLIRTNIKFTNGFNPDSFLNISREEEEIYFLLGNHNIKPSFDGKSIDYLMGEEIIITDTNDVLDMYSTNQKGVTINGNELIIDETFNSDKIILNKIGSNKNSFLLYTSGNSQKMMSAGNIDFPSSTLKVNVISGSLVINKLDSKNKSNLPSGDAILSGAIYGVYDMNDNLVYEYIIGETNKLTNLKIGKYYVREIKPSIGYNLDNNKYEIDITSDNLDIVLDVYEDVIERKVDIFKVFASDTTGIMSNEEGITFEIYGSGNNLIDTIITDSDGRASTTLPYGVYTFRQVNTTIGYYKIDNFTVTIDRNDERPIYKIISDSEVKSKVRVIKKDLDTDLNILNSNIKFRIFDVNKNDYVYFNVTYPEVDSISIFSLNADGTFITPDYLPFGEYILYEVEESMDGYLYNSDGIKFTIDDNASFINENNDIIIEIPFYNKRVKGKIIINKYGEDIIYDDESYYYKEVFLSDAIFDLYAKEDIYENNVLIYQKGTLISECVSDDGGICIFDDLPLGGYHIKEIKSSNNNVIDDTVYDVNLEYKDQYTSKVVYEMDVFNYLKKGILTINKYDSKDNRRLSNTLIEIRDSNDIVVFKGYTDNNGQIIIDDLLYGDYYLSELEASSGYKLLEDNIYFTLDSDNIVIDVYNDVEYVPNTGMNIGLINLLILIVTVFCIIFTYIFWNVRKLKLLFVFSSIDDNRKNNLAISNFLNNKIKYNYDEKYQYNAIIEIPSIDLKRGIVNLNNKYNDVKYNIELIRDSEDSIVLAAHNGNNYNSYFDNLKNMEFSDHIKYYNNDKIYDYIFSEKYVIKKSGEASIYCPSDKKCIHLITCLDGDNDAQIVYVGYLDNVLDRE